MAQRRSFDKNYLEAEFEKLNTAIKKPLAFYLIGGGAMSFYGVKDATKDLDVILTAQDDLNSLQAALEAEGYQEPNHLVITRPYDEMQTSAMLENQDGFRWDIFLNKVCCKLTLSTEMKNRAASLYQGSSLKVSLLSKEDLFLFKGITFRDVDVDDTAKLAQSGLSWGIIQAECKNQSEASSNCWEDALHQNLLDLKEKYGIEAPIEKSLKITAQRKLVEKALVSQIEKGNNTVRTIAQGLDESPSFIRAELKRLVNKDLIAIDESEKPHKFTLTKGVN